MNKRLFAAIALQVGTIIGAGIFGVPYAIAQVGYFWGVVLVITVTGAMLVNNLMYGELVLRTRGSNRQLASYAEIYLGKWAKHLAGLIMFVGLIGAQIAYLILGGEFLYSLLGASLPGSPLLYGTAFFVLGAVAIYIGITFIARVELFMIAFMAVVLVVLVETNLNMVDWANFVQNDPGYLFVGFGVVLFALGGMSAIPEMDDILKSKKDMRKAIIWGVLIGSIATLVFAFMVVGVSGLQTSPETVHGLEGLAQPISILLLAVFGVLAVGTSFIALGGNLQHMFAFDYKLPKTAAWLIVVGVPFTVYILELTSFISLISLMGAVLGGATGILIIYMYFVAKKQKPTRKPEFQIAWPVWVGALVIAVFALGILYQVYLLF